MAPARHRAPGGPGTGALPRRFGDPHPRRPGPRLALRRPGATSRHRPGAGGVDPWRILQAFQRYLALVPEALLAQALTINDAWVIARDLRGGAATLVWCELCQANYLDMQGSALCGCPICALYAARVGGPRRRCARRFVAHSEPVRTDP